MLKIAIKRLLTVAVMRVILITIYIVNDMGDCSINSKV